MRKAFLASMLPAVVLSLVSCQPYRLESTDYETVVTVYSKGTDFGSYSTFALADEQGLIEIGDEDIDISHAYDEEIFTRIRGNLLARGYQEVEDPETADMLVLAGVTAVTLEVSGCYYWGDYWCWYYPCYSGGGYCYPYSGYNYEYEVGTVIVLMVDREKYDSASKPPALMWTATLGGLIEGFTSSEELLNNVDQAFTQSPYLTK